MKSSKFEIIIRNPEKIKLKQITGGVNFRLDIIK